MLIFGVSRQSKEVEAARPLLGREAGVESGHHVENLPALESELAQFILHPLGLHDLFPMLVLG